MKTVYKVVNRLGKDKFTSLAARRQAEVIYQIGKKSEPPKWLRPTGNPVWSQAYGSFGLFAYDTLEQAVVNLPQSLTVLECETGEEVYTKNALLSLLKGGQVILCDLPFPKGTRTYDWLIPRRIVNEAEKAGAYNRVMGTLES